ncbi:hypothetical protein GCM10009678_34000 [Actinomadura kijaniata]
MPRLLRGAVRPFVSMPARIPPSSAKPHLSSEITAWCEISHYLNLTLDSTKKGDQRPGQRVSARPGVRAGALVAA